jgi:hypothetical protein
MYDFDILKDAKEGPELNPIFFDHGDYTPLETIIEFIQDRERNGRDVVDIKTLLPQLSLNGVAIEEDMQIYLDTKACSSGSLKEALKSPLHHLINTQEKGIKPDKSHFELGTFCHTAFLEPEKFDMLAVEPEGASRSSTDGINKLIAFWENQADQIDSLIAQEAYSHIIGSGLDVDKIDGKRQYLKELQKRVGKVSVDVKSKTIVDLIKRNYYRYGGGIIPALLKGSVPEVSMYWTDEETGLPCKIRPDAFQLEENIGCNAIISFKTTHADNIGKMAYDAAKYMYHLSEGMYCEGFEAVTGRKCGGVFCVMLQTVLPYLPVVFYYAPEDLANGKYRYRTALRNVREAMDAEQWPGFDSYAEAGNMGIIVNPLPEWSRREVIPQTIE